MRNFVRITSKPTEWRGYLVLTCESQKKSRFSFQRVKIMLIFFAKTFSNLLNSFQKTKDETRSNKQIDVPTPVGPIIMYLKTNWLVCCDDWTCWFCGSILKQTKMNLVWEATTLSSKLLELYIARTLIYTIQQSYWIWFQFQNLNAFFQIGKIERVFAHFLFYDVNGTKQFRVRFKMYILKST
jgi:hypothetical protein